MTVTLEHRVKRLEKQVTILRAKIKANDLWKLELQTWIHKKFKKLIIDQVPCSVSSDESSESLAASDNEDGTDPEYRVSMPVRKRARLIPASRRSTRKRQGKRQIVEQSSEIRCGPSTEVNGASTSQSASIKTETESHVSSDLQNKVEVPSSGTVSVRDDDMEEGEKEPTKRGLNNGGSGLDDQSKESAPTASVHRPDPPSGRNKTASNDSIMEIRPDLQKYFKFVGSPNDEEGLRVACLVGGCQSILRIKPSTKWSNPVRHLAGVHKIREYVEQAPSAVASRSRSQDLKEF